MSGVVITRPLPLEGGGQGGGESVGLTLSHIATRAVLHVSRSTISPTPCPLPSREGETLASVALNAATHHIGLASC